MKLTTRDSVGILIVLGTAGALLVHNLPTGHLETHVRPVADAGGAVTSAVEVSTVVFHDVNVVSMDGRGAARRQVVVVRDGFVARVGPLGAIEVPEPSLRIEGGGTRWLAPGLTDAHVHLGDEPEALLPLFIANGITTVFNLDGGAQHLELREKVRTGQVAGPTIYTAGPFVDDVLVRSPDDARSVVRQHREQGYDFLKVHGDLPRESFEALTRAGIEEGIAVVGHAPRNLPFSAVLENRQAGISHAEELIYTEFESLDPVELPRVAQAMSGAGTWMTPALASFENIAAQWGEPEGLRAALDRESARFLPPSMLRKWTSSNEWIGRDRGERARMGQMLAFHDPLIRTLHEAGVPMLAGTDAGLPGMAPGFSLHDEMSALHRVGLTRLDALAAATTNAGRFVQAHVDATASFGTVRPESRADLLLVADDPREDLDVLRQPLGVMVRGRWYDRAALDRMLSEARDAR